MPRVKGGNVARKRRKKILKLAKGYYGSKHTLFRFPHVTSSCVPFSHFFPYLFLFTSFTFSFIPFLLISFSLPYYQLVLFLPSSLPSFLTYLLIYLSFSPPSILASTFPSVLLSFLPLYLHPFLFSSSFISQTRRSSVSWLSHFY